MSLHTFVIPYLTGTYAFCYIGEKKREERGERGEERGEKREGRGERREER